MDFSKLKGFGSSLGLFLVEFKLSSRAWQKGFKKAKELEKGAFLFLEFNH